jgi:hypothetical protein
MYPKINIQPVRDEFEGRPFTFYEVSSPSHDETITTDSLERAEEIADEMAEEILNENNNSC